jgi:hypothetical protein
MLAHAGGAPEFASSALVAVGMVLGWIGLSRLRGRGFGQLPGWGAWTLIGLAPVVLIASFVVPSKLWPQPSGVRPTSTATIAFAEPSPGQIVGGGDLEVLVRVEGARIIEGSSTDIAPDTGHLHLFLNGAIVSMTSGEVQHVSLQDLDPGVHELQAEFVAADHAPFDPRVVITTTFVKDGT